MTGTLCGEMKNISIEFMADFMLVKVHTETFKLSHELRFHDVDGHSVKKLLQLCSSQQCYVDYYVDMKNK